MKIPEYFSREPMETSRLPRAPMGIADTGQGLVGQAIAGLGWELRRTGQLLGDIEAERQRGRDNVVLAEMKGVLDDFEFKARPDPTTFKEIADFAKAEEKYGKDWKRETQRISKGANRQVAENFKIYTEWHRDKARRDYHNKSWPLEQNYARAQLNRLWSDKFRKFVNEPVKLKKELQALLEQFDIYLKPTDKQKLDASIDEEIALFQRQDTLDKLHETAKAMPYKSAIGFLNDIKGLESAERNDLIARRKRQNEIETATTNRQVRWDVLREVTSNPQGITDDYLESLVKPNSLTWDDAEEFKKMRDNASEPLKTPRAQLYLNSLNTLFDERETDDEERLKYDIANEKLMQFFKDNPKATANQAAEFYDELIEPEARGIINKAWNIWLQSPFGVLGRRVLGVKKEGEEKLPEPATLEDFEDTVRLLDEDDAKAYYEKWKNKW